MKNQLFEKKFPRKPFIIYLYQKEKKVAIKWSTPEQFVRKSYNYIHRKFKMAKNKV